MATFAYKEILGTVCLYFLLLTQHPEAVCSEQGRKFVVKKTIQTVQHDPSAYFEWVDFLHDFLRLKRRLHLLQENYYSSYLGEEEEGECNCTQKRGKG